MTILNFSPDQILDSVDALDRPIMELRELCRLMTLIPEEAQTTPRFNALARHGPQMPTILDSVESKELAINSLIKNNPVLSAHYECRDFKSMLDSLEYISRGNKATKLGWRSSPYLLLSCALSGIATQTIYLQAGSTPPAMGAGEWDQLEDAVSTLLRLQNSHGLKLWKAFKAEDGSFVFDWAEQFFERIQVSKKLASKPHTDKSATDREAVRKFVELLLIAFDEAPPVLVEKFAHMIDYNPKAASQKIDRWVAAFRANTLF